jgi:hypothetical protein
VIYESLNFLAERLNNYIQRNVISVAESPVILSRLVESDGKSAEGTTDKLILSLVNVEKDTLVQPFSSNGYNANGQCIVSASPIYMNLHVILAANTKSDNYKKALKLLSSGMSFFQNNSVFDRQNSPNMPEGLEKLIIDVENIKIQEMNNLWSSIGTKYMPSVLYKVRTVALGGGFVSATPPAIRTQEKPSVDIKDDQKAEDEA